MTASARQTLHDLLAIIQRLLACEADLTDATEGSDEEAFLIEQHDDLMGDLFERADTYHEAPQVWRVAVSA